MAARGPDTTPSVLTSGDFTQGPLCPRTRELEAEIVELASNIHSTEAQLATRLAELDNLGGWSGDGFHTMAQWLSVRTGFTIGDANKRCRVADRATECPGVIAAATAATSAHGGETTTASTSTPNSAAMTAPPTKPPSRLPAASATATTTCALPSKGSAASATKY